MKIMDDIYHSILSAFPAVPPESGCILGSRNGQICAFAYDAGLPQGNAAIYTPKVEVLNRKIQQWEAAGIQFSGFAHSHPTGQDTLSSSDAAYIHSIMNAMPTSVKKLYFPLVFPGDKIISFAAVKRKGKIEIIPDNITIIKTKE